MNTQLKIFVAFVVAFLDVSAERVYSQTNVPAYLLTDLGNLGGNYSEAHGLNDQGQVVGYSSNTNGQARAFLYTDGNMQDLGTLGGNYSIALGINKRGEIVGNSRTNNAYDFFHAFRYFNGVIQDIGTLGGDYSSANAINDDGFIVGESHTSSNAARHPFLYTNGSMQDLGTLGAPLAGASGINASGEIVGTSQTSVNPDINHAFLYSGGLMQDLGTLGGNSSDAQGANDLGAVVGSSWTSNGFYHPFLYSGGSMQDLGTLPGGDSGDAYDINNSGEIVGRSTADAASNINQHAFLYSDGVMRDLNSLVVNLEGWELYEARAINEAGQIVCNGIHPSGKYGAFLLTPFLAPLIISNVTITPPVLPQEPAVFSFQFQTIALHFYLVKFKTSLADTVWTWKQVIAGNGNVATFNDPVIFPSALYCVQRFSTGFLSFPIKGLTPSTADISAVFDHSQPNNCSNGVVVAFTGEIGHVAFGKSQFSAIGECAGHRLYGFSNALDGVSTKFTVNGHYTGGAPALPDGNNSPFFLFYDGHTGYDFPYDHSYEVVAAAAGVVHTNGDSFNTVWIDHENGYSTWYLHMLPEDTASLTNGTSVTQGQHLGYCGNYYQTPGGIGQHLHFTVKKYGVRVDPYGWAGQGIDPWPTDGIPGHTNDNVILWKEFP